jgi:hypothetical protein
MSKLKIYLLPVFIIICAVFSQEIWGFIGAFTREELIRILPMPISVFMGFIAIHFNHIFAAQRETRKLKSEKIEELNFAYLEYTQSCTELLFLHHNNAVLIKRMHGSFVYDDGITELLKMTCDIRAVRRNAKDKMEMLCDLYFPNEENPSKNYGLDSLLMNKLEPENVLSPGYLQIGDLQASLDVVNSAESVLKTFFNRLMLDTIGNA